LRVLDGHILAGWSDDPLQGSDDPGFAIGMDWLYADLNGNGVRDFGRDAGYDDAAPSFGEPLYVADDVDEDGILEPGEKLFALASSKIALVRIDDDVYRRGENLVDVPRERAISHGTGSSGVMVGGQLGLSRKVGVAPDADLIMATQRESYGAELEMTDFCIEQGARVVLHEYAPWVGYHLDGSSAMEGFIDQTTIDDGVAHINPAGNLSGSAKLYKRAHPAGAETVIEIAVPDDFSEEADFRYLGLALLWREPSRALTVRIEEPSGFGMDLPASTGWTTEEWHDGLYVFTQRNTSSRDTVKIDVWIWSEGPAAAAVPTGTWLARVADPAPASSSPVEVIAYVSDDLSSWSQGIYFPSHVSEDHLIGYPGTADYGIAVAATTGHGYWPRPDWATDPGERAPYSGRGHRIDGEAILDIAAPDDPVTADYDEDREATYGIYGGTSGASPHVAGAAALLVQADPSRDGVDLRQAIRDGALADEAVGMAPNDDYGYGKLRIYESMFGIGPPGGSAPVLEEITTTVPVGYTVHIPVHVEDDDGAPHVTVELDRDYDGVFEEQLHRDAVLGAPFFDVTFDEPGSHVLGLRATDLTGRQDRTLAFVTAERWRFLEPAGGCACASAPLRPSRLGWLAALSLLGLLATRRRNRAPLGSH
jgi:subtilisin family serine protease